MKRVEWGTNPQLGGPKRLTMEAKVRQQLGQAEELEKAAETFKKYLPLMAALLEERLKKGTSLKILRRLEYTTSDLSESVEDDGFYTVRKSEHALGKFVDTQVEIPVGEVLIFKSLYPAMREFIFEDSKGKEHAISFDQKNKLMTCTDIYETVAEFMGD